MGRQERRRDDDELDRVRGRRAGVDAHRIREVGAGHARRTILRYLRRMSRKKLLSICLAAAAVMVGYGIMKTNPAEAASSGRVFELRTYTDRKSTRLNSSHLVISYAV